jgi:TonB family protein
MARPDAGVTEPGSGRRIAGIVATLLFFGFIFFIFTFRDLAPTGFKVGKPSAEVGELVVPDDGLERMTFSSEKELRAEVESGVASASDTLCVHASPEVLGQIEAAVRPVPRGPYGGRALWVEAVAERRFGPSPCRQRHAREGRTALGPLLRIVSIARIRPLGCDPLIFRVNRLKCPEPSPAKPPAVIDDAKGQLYPEAALKAGKEGRTTVRLLADSQNVVLGCDVVESSGDASLDSATCDAFRKRPHLIPKQGRTQGYATGVREVTQAISWRLPD